MLNNKNRIFLIGYMGAGKTTIGKHLSNYINYSFVDLDEYIEKKYNETISSIFLTKGEDFFRKIERLSLKNILRLDNLVIAVGGGTPCFFNNMDLMNQGSITIYLKANIDDLISRILISNPNRPIIKDKTDDELLYFISNHLKEREPFYNKAKIIHNTNKLITTTDILDTVKLISEKIDNLV